MTTNISAINDMLISYLIRFMLFLIALWIALWILKILFRLLFGNRDYDTEYHRNDYNDELKYEYDISRMDKMCTELSKIEDEILSKRVKKEIKDVICLYERLANPKISNDENNQSFRNIVNIHNLIMENLKAFLKAEVLQSNSFSNIEIITIEALNLVENQLISYINDLSEADEMTINVTKKVIEGTTTNKNNLFREKH